MSHIELLKEHGLKATHQRLLILKILSRCTHPTIDELYETIKEEHPSVSLATVYKNLNTLIDEGIVSRLSISNQKVKFDINEEPHIHIICKNCGEVYDCDKQTALIDEYKEKLEKNIGEKIEKISVVVNTNNCTKCKK
ncbi:peroxide stress transcriptional regulator PerR [Campylobacter blaseri]|uniref:Ferric uptake regulation protein n=1 Tax=Campylobacter blaseri TaxID=2042961 RepID=A0A2P8R163_9BACT|nr:Fur family transcriptional regulator [Campylobacter blaseri]PSM52235.1 transcriptional repressor [Campylobacter blaseri]PSM54001.1 transcriptional repressor [Campylobacter blaseri]QKF85439.1 peroxide stress transcriptional regulator PerR [Campylobacter blaseri]